MSEESEFSAIGGWLCIDFTNTVGGRRARDGAAGAAGDWEVLRDDLRSYADFVRWTRQFNILDDEEAARLRERAQADVGAAEDVLAHARALRETVYRVFAAHALRGQPSAQDLVALNAVLGEGLPHLELAATADGFAWRWRAESRPLDWPLWAIARSAADLLTSESLARVGRCGGNDCGWLYLDTTKNHSRRWCSMQDCGNRAKARRHYQRKQAVAPTE